MNSLFSFKATLIILITFYCLRSSSTNIPVNYTFFNDGDTVIVSIGDVLQFTPSQTSYSVMISPSTTFYAAPYNYTVTGTETSFKMKDGVNPPLNGYLKFTAATSIHSVSKENIHIGLYPNPATNNLSIVSPLKGNATITNAYGSFILNKFIEAGIVTEINLIDLEAGVYFITVSGITRRFIKE